MINMLNFKELNEVTHDCQWNNTQTERDWVNENVTGFFIEGAMYITFFDKEDAFAFKMRWL